MEITHELITESGDMNSTSSKMESQCREQTEMISEIDKNKYEPENYFINYLKCIE